VAEAGKMVQKNGGSAVLPLFFFLVILAFLSISHQSVHVGFCSQQFPHLIAGVPILSIVFFFFPTSEHTGL